MAIDTQAKRMSITAISMYAMGPSVLPSGTFTQAQRQTTGYGYYGILVQSPAGVTDVFIQNRHGIQRGIRANTAAGMGGVIIGDL